MELLRRKHFDTMLSIWMFYSLALWNYLHKSLSDSLLRKKINYTSKISIHSMLRKKGKSTFDHFLKLSNYYILKKWNLSILDPAVPHLAAPLQLAQL